MLPGLIVLAIAVVTGSAFAQSPAEKYSGRTITAVSVVVDQQPTTEPALLELVETKVGEPLVTPAVRETITHFYSLGRFQDIQVDASDAGGGGVALRYTLIPLRAIASVEFRGRLGLSEGLLRNTVEDRFGRTPQLGRVAEVARVLEQLYEGHGYSRVTIRPVSTDYDNPRRTVLAFEIESGPQARVGEITIAGDANTTRADLLGRLRLAPGRPYERVELERRLTEYTQHLRKGGYLDATASHRPRISDDGQVADIVLDVQPGPVVSVVFQGDPLPPNRREELVPIQREGSVDEDLLEDSDQRITEFLRQQGFWKADVSVERQEADKQLTIIFAVRKGPLYRVAPEGAGVVGNTSVPIEAIRPLIVAAPGQPYVAAHLDAAEGAIERLYRERGFALADAETAENEVGDSGAERQVRPVITIKEGPRSLIGQISITGVQALSEAEILRVVKLTPGSSFYEPMVRADRDAIELEYRNLGHASVHVTVTPTISDDRARIDLTYAVAEGPQTIVDHVIVVGNNRTSEDLIRREVVLRPGEPLGLRDVLESRRRLSQLGLFRRIDIRELEHGPPTRRDVLVTVEEAPATTIGYGGGLELTRVRIEGESGDAEERIEFAPRGFFDVSRRNLGGKNRSISLFTRASVRLRDEPATPDDETRGLDFGEYRVVGTFREPRAFDRNADLVLTGAVEQGVRSSFNFVRKGVTAEMLRHLTPTIRASVRYSFGTTRTFDEKLVGDELAAIDRAFSRVRLSTFSGAIVRDTRDDVVEPSAGTFLSAESSLATRALGGEVGFMKAYVQALWFKQVSRARRIIFATRVATGLADGFERPSTQPGEAPIEDLPAAERFYAGGDTTIRGFALDTVGAANTISETGFPRGGNAVLILNGELRVPVWKDIGAAVFVDGGNVFERVTQFDFEELRGSVGFGLRYLSPIGPVRLDLGFKMDRRPFAGELEPRAVFHFSIGQAF